ncbi:hypothetical protein HZS_5909 [Henneguya salminicola]|nr:hypothetical protein HZS_5909 [Henneguya salminicola]
MKSKLSKKDYIFCIPHSHILTNKQAINNSLHEWYDKNKRQFPWRDCHQNDSISQKLYKVMVSEAMLQQTQTSTVIPYYVKWIEKWPTIKKLCQASEQEVLSHWSGLGYYSRARRLFSSLTKINQEYPTEQKFKEFDYSIKSLRKLPGVGEYTASAIQSIVFNQATASVDGNFIRVFSRVFAVRQYDTLNLKTIKLIIQDLCDKIITEDRPGDFNQCIMDIANIYCLPTVTPKCHLCPLNKFCYVFQSFQNNINIEELNTNCPSCISISNDLTILDYPGKLPRCNRKTEFFFSIIIHVKGSLLLRRRKSKGLLAGMLDLPSYQIDSPCKIWNFDYFCSCLQNFDYNPLDVSYTFVGEFKHLFTHLHHSYYVYSVTSGINLSSLIKNTSEFIVINVDEVKSYPLCTSVKKILRSFKQL